MKPFISFAIKKCTVPSKDRGVYGGDGYRAGFTPEYYFQLKKARPEGREILAMGCLQGAP
ncbi:hypothetical protein FIQ61_19730 [Salmonella enterica subsp. enterica]|nr:hypothetical protein [Salmonella enterica subsp. enterica serovar Stanley]